MRPFLVGYYGFGNVGDEWLLTKTQLWLSDRFSVSSFLVRGPSYLAYVRDFFRCDAVVFGGGSLLQNKTSQLSLLVYAGTLLAARFLGKRRLLLAQGIGPLTGGFSSVLVKWALSGAECLEVRDSGSQMVLAEWGIEADLVKDLACYGVDVPNKCVPQGDKLGVCFRGLSESDMKRVSEVISELDRELVVIPMHAPEDVTSSLAVLPDSGVAVVPIELVKSRVLGEKPVCEGLGCIVSARFHLCMHAGLMGIPFVALDGDPKMAGVAALFDQPCVTPADFSVSDVLAATESL